MPTSSDTDHLSVLEINGPFRKYSALERMLGYIVFEGHGIRIGLELTACVFAHALLQLLLPWKALGLEPATASLYSWFACCIAVILFDLCVLCRSAHVFRRAYLLGLQGEYESALKILNDIGPESRRLVRLPLRFYHLYRAELAAHQGQPQELTKALDLAEETGLPRDRVQFQRIQLMRVIGEVRSCHDLLTELATELGEGSELLVEKARTFAASREDWQKVKQAARRAKKLPDSAHFSGERCHRLASAYEAVAMLWTGEAEEGLPQLNEELELLRRSMLYVDSLRPIFSQLLLERSLYLATHKEPTLAVYDYTLSRALCTQDEFESISEQIRSELAERFAISLT